MYGDLKEFDIVEINANNHREVAFAHRSANPATEYVFHDTSED